jgi:hypothetical protein
MGVNASKVSRYETVGDNVGVFGGNPIALQDCGYE